MLMNMTEILRVAEEQKFAVPAFNIGSGVKTIGDFAFSKVVTKRSLPYIKSIRPPRIADGTNTSRLSGQL